MVIEFTNVRADTRIGILIKNSLFVKTHAVYAHRHRGREYACVVINGNMPDWSGVCGVHVMMMVTWKMCPVRMAIHRYFTNSERFEWECQRCAHTNIWIWLAFVGRARACGFAWLFILCARERAAYIRSAMQRKQSREWNRRTILGKLQTTRMQTARGFDPGWTAYSIFPSLSISHFAYKYNGCSAHKWATCMWRTCE